jgi:hypothetical protein
MGVIAFLAGVLGFASSRSDIQIIIGLVGIFSAAIMFGMSSILGKIESIKKG